MALAGTQQIRSQDPMSVHAHSTEGVTRSKRRERVNMIGDGIGIGGGNGVGNGDGNEVGVTNGALNGDGDGDRAATRRRVEAK